MLALSSEMNWMLAVASAVALVLWIILRTWARRQAGRIRTMRHHLLDGSLSPRAQHYHFAHTALRQKAYEDPDGLVEKLSDPECDPFLLNLWKAVGNEYRNSVDEPEPEPISSEGLDACAARVAHRPAALVTLPVPHSATEAYFVAIVLNHDLDESPRGAPEPPVYFFTLEKGFSLDETPRTVFCQWEDNAHRNFGDGPPPDPRAFLDRIVRHFEDRSQKSVVSSQ